MSRQNRQRSSLRTVFLVLIAIAAWYSNPDDRHFERWLQRHSEVHERRMEDDAVPVASVADREHTNFGLFTVVTVFDSQPRTYWGAFGRWWVVQGARQ